MTIDSRLTKWNSAEWKASFRSRLVAWFRKNARDLPWRQSRDPYSVWVSEIMLQQTQALMVVPYYQRFLERFPDLEALSAAHESEVLRYWEGLGYYRRARQMHLAARELVAKKPTDDRAEFPRRYEDVLALPGIGRYTAGAILSISCDERLPILEANTIRLLSRLTAFTGDADSAAGKRHLWSFAESILPRRNCGEFNQALMELGALICTPKSPACERCPARRLCPTRERSLQDFIPRPKAKKTYEDSFEAALLVERENLVALRRCLPGERWAGLWDFPRFKLGSLPSDTSERAIATTLKKLAEERLSGRIVIGPRLATIRHAVTRFRITLACYRARWIGVPRAISCDVASDAQFVWVRPEDLGDYALSSTGRTIGELAKREGMPP